MIVVDSNVLAARAMCGVNTELAAQVEAIESLWVVPVLWRYELQNILAMATRARKITPKAAADAWSRLQAMLAENEHDPSAQRVLDLAERHRISAYDANFIALAVEIGTVCVTEDRELREKFPAIAVSMSEFVRQQGGWTVREARAPYGATAGAKPKAGR